MYPHLSFFLDKRVLEKPPGILVLIHGWCGVPSSCPPMLAVSLLLSAFPRGILGPAMAQPFASFKA